MDPNMSSLPLYEGTGDAMDMDSLLRRLQTQSQHLHQNSEQQVEFLRRLPKLREQDIPRADDSCPICQDTFLAVIATEEMAIAMDTPGLPEEQLGVTRLPCGHLFCKKDISVWISSAHNTCPSCRATLPIPSGPAVEEEEALDLSNWTEEERRLLNAALGAAQAERPPVPNIRAEPLSTFIPFRRPARDDDYEPDNGYSAMYS